MLDENNRKKYTQCKLVPLQDEISKEEVISGADVSENQVDDHICKGTNLARGHGSQKPYPDEAVFRILKLLSNVRPQAEICKKNRKRNNR